MKEWNPQYVAYANAHGMTPEEMLEHDIDICEEGEERPVRNMCGFMLWNREQWDQWFLDRKGFEKPYDYPLSDKDIADFRLWLQAKYPPPKREENRVNEHSIIVNEREARGLHSGAITQLWRAIDPPLTQRNDSKLWSHFARPDDWLFITDDPARSEDFRKRCPFGQAGDRLLVLEDGAMVWNAFVYKAGNDPSSLRYKHECQPNWKPAASMPRAAVRTVLELIQVRVMRPRDATEADALAFGGWKYLGCPVHKDPEASLQLTLEMDLGPSNLDLWHWVLTVQRIEA